MIKVLRSISDTYITNRIIRGESQKSANVGQAGSLDIFKIKSSVRNTEGVLVPFVEYSRGLIKFDLAEVQRLIQDEKIDINHGSFWAKLSLKDAYAGQTTPRMFQVDVNRLRKPFDEGVGKDVVLYSDLDTGNFISSSFDIETSQFTLWDEEGCSSNTEDFYPGEESQIFETGEEDLLVDVTDQLKTMLEDNENHGFRISLSDQILENDKNYFVKRFSTRHSYDELKRPGLILGFDDSVVDSGSKMTLNTTASFVIRNYRNGDLSNIIDRDGLELTGSNCLTFKVSGNAGDPISFPASQVYLGSLAQTGVYSASVSLTYNNLTDLLIPESSASIGIFSTPKTDDNDKGFQFYDSSGRKGVFVFTTDDIDPSFDYDESDEMSDITFTIPFLSKSVEEISTSISSLINDLDSGVFKVESTLKNNRNGTFSIGVVQSETGLSENNRFISSIGDYLPQGVNVTHFNIPQLTHGSYHLTGSWIHSVDGYELGKSRTFEILSYQSEDSINNLNLDVSSVILDEINHGDVQTVSVFLFDKNSIKTSQKVFSKSLGNLQGIASEAHYRIKEVVSGEVVIPFDIERGSTKLSADTEKLFFELDTGNLFPNRAYVIDILLMTQGKNVVFRNSSPQFKVI
jgi:hypothetical protein